MKIRSPLLVFTWAILLVYVNYHQVGFVDGRIEALYAFGDSYVDTGNFEHGEGTLVWAKPYGSSWPGYGDGRFGNGHVQTDYIAKLLGLQSPTPFKQMVGNRSVAGGINFGVGGAGVTYVTGKPTLNVQVAEFEALASARMFSQKHLKHAAALVCMAVNDYTSYTGQAQTIPAFVDIVVDALAWNVLRLHKLGLRNFIVANVAPMACWPLYTSALNYSQCSDNVTLTYQTRLHNEKLEAAVETLHKQLDGIQILLLNQTKVFEHLVHHGAELGFVQTLTPCCKGTLDNDVFKCGTVDEAGAPLYRVCDEPQKTLFWDAWHPTEAGWKAAIHLYTTRPEYTKFGNNLKDWMQKIE